MAGIPAFQLGNIGSPTLQPLAVAVLIHPETQVALPVMLDTNTWIPSPVVVVEVGGVGAQDAVGYAG